MKKRAFLVVFVIIAAATLYLWGHWDGRTGRAIGLADVAVADESQSKLSPVKPRPRDVYYPNSEELGPKEMRVIACGTGMPTTRAAQRHSTPPVFSPVFSPEIRGIAGEGDWMAPSTMKRF